MKTDLTTTIDDLQCRIDGCKWIDRCPIKSNPDDLKEWFAVNKELKLSPIFYYCPLCIHPVWLARNHEEIAAIKELDHDVYVYPTNIKPEQFYAIQLISKFGEDRVVELAQAMIQNHILTEIPNIPNTDNVNLVALVFCRALHEFEFRITLLELDESNGIVRATIFHGLDLAGYSECFIFRRESQGLKFVESHKLGIS